MLMSAGEVLRETHAKAENILNSHLHLKLHVSEGKESTEALTDDTAQRSRAGQIRAEQSKAREPLKYQDDR